MNESDIEFTLGLDTSPALQKLDEFQDHMSMADAAFERATGDFEPPKDYGRPNIGPTGADYPRSGAMADNFFEKTVSAKLAKEAEILAKSDSSVYSKIKDAIFGRKGDASDKFDNAANGGVPPKAPNYEENASDEESINKTDEIKQNEQEITEEAKAQNREMNEHHIKLGKTLTVLGVILGIIKSIKKAWAGAFDQQAKLLQASGFFTKDPRGYFQSGTNKEYAMIIAGIEAMGKASPFSKEAIDSVLSKIQNARNEAMMGHGVDEKLSIAVQMLNDRLGTKFNAQQLLTGDPSRTNVEILKEILNTLEKSMPKLAEMNEQELSRTMGYISTLIGPELADAIAANFALNIRTGSTETAMDKVVSHGAAGLPYGPIAKATKNITDASAELNESFGTLSQLLTITFSPALTKFINGLTKLVDWLNEKFHWWGSENVVDDWNRGLGITSSVVPYFDKAGSGYEWANREESIFKTRGGGERKRNESKDKEDAKKGLADIKNVSAKIQEYNTSGDANKILNAVVLKQAATAGKDFGPALESKKILMQAEAIFMLQKHNKLSDNQFDKIYEGDETFGTMGSLAKSLLGDKKFNTYAEMADYLNQFQTWRELQHTLYEEGGKLDVTKGVFSNAEFMEYLFGKGLPESISWEMYQQYAKGHNAFNTGEQWEGKQEQNMNGEIVIRLEGLNVDNKTTSVVVDKNTWSALMKAELQK